jgi:hypothetical protein
VLVNPAASEEPDGTELDNDGTREIGVPCRISFKSRVWPSRSKPEINPMLDLFEYRSYESSSSVDVRTAAKSSSFSS